LEQLAHRDGRYGRRHIGKYSSMRWIEVHPPLADELKRRRGDVVFVVLPIRKSR
jgi:hypothetical protein